MPSGSGVATIQFEKFGQAVNEYQSFLHVDFLNEHTIEPTPVW